jgi:3-oxoacid CoA-transferase subunit A/glutaconate CoA-transferase subunit A
MLGTDTLKKSACKVVADPWTGKPICLIPAAFPDVAIFHVPRCDKYGNAQIDGIIVEDFELARAARRVLITAEEIIEEDVIRNEPSRTAIPFYVVDAVCHVPFGAHPTQMPYRYFFDEAHIAEWLRLAETAEGAQEYFEKYVFGASDFEEYLERVGGIRKINYLGRMMRFQEPMPAPGLNH